MVWGLLCQTERAPSVLGVLLGVTLLPSRRGHERPLLFASPATYALLCRCACCFVWLRAPGGLSLNYARKSSPPFGRISVEASPPAGRGVNEHVFTYNVNTII